MPQPLPPEPDDEFFAAVRAFAARIPGKHGRAKSITIHTKGGLDYPFRIPDAPPTPPTPPTPEAAPALPARYAGPGFRMIRWDGWPYYFTELQAKVVAILWREWERGTPDVAQKDLRREADVHTERLSELFADNTAWGTVIFKGHTQGTFRLGHSDEDV